MLNSKQLFSRSAAISAIALSALFVACGGDTAKSAPPPPPADQTAPTAVITDDVPGATATGDVTFTITFSEAIDPSFSAASVTVTGGTKGTFTSVSSTVCTLVVSPTANATGTIVVTLAVGSFKDLANNLNTASAMDSQDYDTIPVAQVVLGFEGTPATAFYNLMDDYDIEFGGPLTDDMTFAQDAAVFDTGAHSELITATAYHNKYESPAAVGFAAFCHLDQAGLTTPIDLTHKTVSLRIRVPAASYIDGVKLVFRTDADQSQGKVVGVSAKDTWMTISYAYADGTPTGTGSATSDYTGANFDITQVTRIGIIASCKNPTPTTNLPGTQIYIDTLTW